jgi:hypothetical protein
MRCLSKEQITRLTIGAEEDAALAAHVEQCPTCRANVEALRTLTAQLSAAYGELDRGHQQGRARLMASLSTIEVSAPPVGASNSLTSRFAGLTVGQRVTVGGVGLSTIVGLVLLLLALNSGMQLSAMERMAKKLHEVKSYSYKLSTQNTFVKEGRTQPTYVKRTGTAYWSAPGSSLFAEEEIVHVDGPIRPGDDQGELVVHITEIYPAGKPGIIIDHLAKTFVWLAELRADDIQGDSPINLLRRVREGEGKVVRGLGTKAIQEKSARGYIMALKDAVAGSGPDALEVWVDPETDLPLEFGYTIKNDKGPEFFRVTDCRWNIVVDPKLFATTAPRDYADITPPSGEKELGQIAEALRLFAKLSDGHYPRVTEFDGDAVRDEMLKLAGFTGPPQPQWTHDKRFLQIQQTKGGLDWIARILRNKDCAGYLGMKIGPQDHDQVLLWWRMFIPDCCRVFYGDLRTEIVTEAQLTELGLPEAARSMPEDDQEPNENH